MRRTFNVTNVELVKDALTTTKETLEELELDKILIGINMFLNA